MVKFFHISTSKCPLGSIYTKTAVRSNNPSPELIYNYVLKYVTCSCNMVDSNMVMYRHVVAFTCLYTKILEKIHGFSWLSGCGLGFKRQGTWRVIVLGVIVSGRPNSLVKKSCVGILHMLTHIPTHPLDSRYLSSITSLVLLVPLPRNLTGWATRKDVSQEEKLSNE